MIEKLEYNKNDKGFWMQYYVPFYVKAFAEGRFNVMMNFLFGAFKIKTVDAFLAKNKKEVDAFIKFELDYFQKYGNRRF